MFAPCLPTTVLIEPERSRPVHRRDAKSGRDLGQHLADIPVEVAAGGARSRLARPRTGHSVRWTADRPARCGSGPTIGSPGTGRQQPAIVEGDPGRQAGQGVPDRCGCRRRGRRSGITVVSSSPCADSARFSSGCIALQHRARRDRSVAHRAQQIVDRLVAQRLQHALQLLVGTPPAPDAPPWSASRGHARHAPRAGAGADGGGCAPAPCR